jgi:hypothetical protein
MPSASGWAGFRRIEIRRRGAGPSALVGEGEHWATIACRVAVRSPTLGVSSQTARRPTAAGLFF